MKKLLLTLMLFATAVFSFGQTVENFTSSTTWECPIGVTSVQVECWGAGGSGGSAVGSAGRAGGGGGGGSYVVNTLTVTPGTVYTITVGNGGAAGLTQSANCSGKQGGKSEFSGPSITTITASGGAAGTGANFLNSPGPGGAGGVGGVLGGIYGISIDNAGSGYTVAPTVTISGGGGSGATANASASGAVSFFTAMTQGSGYTSVPTVTITGDGTGAAGTALLNLDVDAGGTITKGNNGGDAVFGANSGAGGKGANGGNGGNAVTTGVVGLAGTAPGGGGSGGYSTGASRVGGAGAKGQVRLTYTSATTLPVSLTSFTAQKQASGALLKWNTSSEQNNSHFDVQRSTDGVNFNTIGKVNGSGNSSSSIDYLFLDKSPLAGTNYYRLCQVNFNGKTTLFTPAVVNFGFSNSSIIVYSSSSSSDINVNMSTDRASSGMFAIYNITGQKVFEQAISLNSGSNNFSVSVPTLDKGIFIATYNNGLQVLRSKFIR